MIILLALFIFLSIPKLALAHCPLCTVGAAAAGGVAAWLGVSGAVVGIFVGGASLLLGWWLAKRIKRKFVPYQEQILAFLIYLSVVLPAYPFVKDYTSLYISLFGDYGTILHNTYLINLFILGSVIGAIVVLISPYISKLASKLSGGGRIHFQGVVVTIVLLTVVSVLIELMI